MAPWLFLGFAVVAEVIGTLALKATEGFTRLGPSIVVGVGYASATVLLAIAVRSLPVSIAYAIWAACGTTSAALIGMALLGEPAGMMRIASVSLVIVGIIGLNLAQAR